jgi:nitrogenase-stabilizing/protective protein
METWALPELAGASDAEEFFEALGVPFERRVLALHRLHVLKRFAEAAAAFRRDHPEASEPELRATLREALREAHDRFVGGGAPPENPFRPAPRGQVVQLGRRGGE